MSSSDSDLAASAIVPREIIIHLTLQCPLRCAHCCVNSDMSKKGHLDLESVLRLIDEASHIQTVERVDFVGGDPFLHQDILEAAFRRAAERNLKTAVVTSGYWATSEAKALKVLKPLAEAGLGRITLSYDDPHAEFVPEEKIVWAFRAAQELGLETFVAVTVEPGSRITQKYMEALLRDAPRGGSRVHIYETAVNSTGRAEEEGTPEQRAVRRKNELSYRGPCLSILRQSSILSTGKMVPCCGVIPFRPGLQMGDIARDTVDEALTRAFNNWVFKWIAFEGPVAILRQLTAETEHPLKDEDFDGICNACDLLFTTPEYLELLHNALPDKLASLQLQEEIYSNTGLFEPPTVRGSAAAARHSRQLPILQQ